MLILLKKLFLQFAYKLYQCYILFSFFTYNKMFALLPNIIIWYVKYAKYIT